MQADELRKVIDVFFEIQEQNQAKLLEDANTIEGLMGLIAKDSFGNGFKREALKKAQQIIMMIEDPRELWHDLETMPVCSYLSELRDSIENRTAVLILRISSETVPQWFVDILRNPRHIPEGFLAIICKKAKQIKDDLSGKMSHIDRVHARTVEMGRR